jgi:hypothetical protein
MTGRRIGIGLLTIALVVVLLDLALMFSARGILYEQVTYSTGSAAPWPPDGPDGRLLATTCVYWWGLGLVDDHGPPTWPTRHCPLIADHRLSLTAAPGP